VSPPRIAPAEPPYAPELEAELARWMPPAAGVEPLRLFRTLVRNLPLAEAMRPLGAHLLSRRASLARREREIVIDRVSARCGCEYEWGVHVAAFGARVGLGEEELRATAAPDASAWRGRDALLVRLVDELHETSQVSGELWRRLEAEYEPGQLLELLVLVGWYHVIAFVANGAGVAREAWAPRLPRPLGRAGA
jgi:alkylhydroperoxidase family enzyme